MNEPFAPHEERDLLAAEYALGLLEGEELLAARGRMTAEPAFAAAVADWERRLSPMFDGVTPVPPPAELWSRIERAIGGPSDASETLVRLRRRERLWKNYAAGVTALAAGLALVLGLRVAQPDAPVPQPAGPAAQAPALVASLAVGEAAVAIAVSPDRRSMVVTPARLTGVDGHSHELWLIPASGTPVSLGVVAPGPPRRHSVPAALVPEVHARTTLAVSVEPTGGSPTGKPTGPVVATAALQSI